MIKLFWLLILNPVLGLIYGITMLQIQPTGDSLAAYLISAIVAESSVIVFMALHIKKLSQIKDKAIETAYHMQIEDQKQVIKHNTAALADNANASKTVAETNKDIAEAVNELRIYLAENLPTR